MLAKEKQHPEWDTVFFCERAVKRCVNVGKNSKKVCVTLLYCRTHFIKRALVFLGEVPFQNVIASTP